MINTKVCRSEKVNTSKVQLECASEYYAFVKSFCLYIYGATVFTLFLYVESLFLRPKDTDT